MRVRYKSIAAVAGSLSLSLALLAEQGKLVLHVADTSGRPVGSLSLAAMGAGGGEQQTDSTGRLLLVLAPETRAGNMVPLQIVRSPHGHDFVIVSPWDGNARIPPFENDAMNFVALVVAERGDKALLENGNALATLAAKINQANAPKTAGRQSAEVSPKESLDAISKQYGLAPEEVDRAIRAWGEKATDPYDVGLAALYARNYPEATKQLTVSLEEREEVLKRDRKKDEDAVAEAASFLGQSLYAQGHYREAAMAQDRALQLRPNDTALINEEGISLLQSGNYKRAESLLRHALVYRTTVLGSDNLDTAVSMNNLAELYRRKGDYADAEPLCQSALAIINKILGPNNAKTAIVVNNLALILKEKKDFAGAEILYDRALSINVKTFGWKNSATVTSLNNLGTFLVAKGDYVSAEQQYRLALGIQKELDANHPNMAAVLSNLAELVEARGDNAVAEAMYYSALSITEKSLGANHPDMATIMNNLAELRQKEGDYKDAEVLYERALRIDEKALGQNHPSTKTIRNSLAIVREKLR